MVGSLEISFHGAARTVTGSCMQLRYGDLAVLIDCGLFQGSRTLETLNREAFPFDASRLAAVILSHAHIDHSGLLPKLVAEGYGGPIWRSEEHTSELQSLMRNSYAVFCLKKKKKKKQIKT